MSSRLKDVGMASLSLDKPPRVAPAKPGKAKKVQYVIFYGLHCDINTLSLIQLLLGENASIGNGVITENGTNYKSTDWHITVSFNTSPDHEKLTTTFETAIAESTSVVVTFTEIRIGPSHIVVKVSLPEGTPYNGHKHPHMTIGVVEGAKPVDSPKLFETDSDVKIIVLKTPVVVTMTYYAQKGWK